MSCAASLAAGTISRLPTALSPTRRPSTITREHLPNYWRQGHETSQARVRNIDFRRPRWPCSAPLSQESPPDSPYVRHTRLCLERRQGRCRATLMRSDMAQHITQQQLESYLWGAATLLRGTIDAGDYEQFIFPLLFYKRICDVFNEETETALKESGGDKAFAAYRENHRFQVPPEAHWLKVRQTSNNVG